MIEPQKIIAIMGMTNNVNSLHELNELVNQGLPKDCLIQTIKHLSSDNKQQKQLQARVISPATFRRRKDVLTTQESELVEHLARVYATAFEVFGDQDDARQYLFTPNPLLNNKSPIDVCFTGLGARLVEETLEKIRYGLPV